MVAADLHHDAEFNRKAFLGLTPEQQDRARIHFQSRSVEWAAFYLGVDPATIVWSLMGPRAAARLPFWIRRRIRDPYEGYRWKGDSNPVARMFRAFDGQARTVSFAAGTGTGKSLGAAILKLHWLWVYPPSNKVFTFATRADQLKDGLWSYTQEFFPAFQEIHPTATLDRLVLRMDHEKADAWAAKGRTFSMRKGEESTVKVHGLHAKHMLIILEELPGIPEGVVNAIMGTVTGEHNVVLALMNPERDGDHAHRFHRTAAVSIRSDARDHPNHVCRDANLIPGATTREWLADQYRFWKDKYDLDSYRDVERLPLFQQKVSGTFSQFASNTLLNPKTIERVQAAVRKPLTERYIDPYQTQTKGWVRTYVKPEACRTHANALLLTIDPAGHNAYDPGRERERDWHFGLLRHLVTGQVVATVRAQGLLEPFIRACLDLCDEYSFRYPRSWEEAQRPESEWGGSQKPMISWARTGGYGQLTLIPELMAYERRGGYLHHHVEQGKDGLPDTPTYGITESGPVRDDLVAALSAWGSVLKDRPELVADETLAHELSVFVGKEVERGGKRTVRYEHQDGEKDDGVMALAQSLHLPVILAAIQIVPRPLPVIQEPPKQVIPIRRSLVPKKKGGWGARLPKSL